MTRDKTSILIIIVLLAIPILLLFCSKNDEQKKEKTTLSKAQIQNLSVEIADLELQGEGEKIILLSLIHKIPADSLHLILKDYYSKTSIDYDYKYLNQVIDTISEKFNVPKSKIANMIYNFRYNSNIRENNINENNEYIPDATAGPDSESAYRY